MNQISVNIQSIIEVARKAGEEIINIYNQSNFEVKEKTNSVVTIADLKSNECITSMLRNLYPTIPIISEESISISYEERKKWDVFFLVDPLDGTKEFIQKNGNFTINIALIQNLAPILGVIYAPIQHITYYAIENKGCFKIVGNKTIQLFKNVTEKPFVKVVVSRSHLCDQTQSYIEKLKNSEKEVLTTSIGSALKFGLIAEGKADLYPRFSPTMEWDTAAGQIIINEIGKKIIRTDNQQVLTYNKPELINPGFIVI